MELLRDEIVNRLENQIKAENMDGDAIQNERHIQSSKPESIIEFEPRSEKEQGENLEQEPETQGRAQGGRQRNIEPIKAFPLGMVLRACPQIGDYGPGGKIDHWRELMAAAVVVRSMLGVSPSAYEEACGSMGPENAAVAMACILEKSNMINSPGGYLRDLAKRSERGEFSLGPMLMALLKAQGLDQRRAG